MGSARPPAQFVLYEPIPARTVYVSGIAEITRIDGNLVCFVLYQTSPDLDPESPATERHVALRVVVPVDAVPVALRQTAVFLAEEAADALRSLAH